MDDEVNFGSIKVPKNSKTKLVSDVFSSVASKYDIMNDLMSLGAHRLWKKRMCQISRLTANDVVLDIACGTGDIAISLLREMKSIKLTCLDENSKMIALCKERLINQGFISNISYVTNPMEKASLQENSFSLATLSFGFRNFTDHNKALENIYKLLSPGGRLVIMEFTSPQNPISKKIFESYTHRIIPRLGKIIAKDDQSYTYLAESISSYYSPEEVSELFYDNKFSNVRYEVLPGEIVTIHIGYKS